MAHRRILRELGFDGMPSSTPSTSDGGDDDDERIPGYLPGHLPGHRTGHPQSSSNSSTSTGHRPEATPTTTSSSSTANPPSPVRTHPPGTTERTTRKGGAMESTVAASPRERILARRRKLTEIEHRFQRLLSECRDHDEARFSKHSAFRDEANSASAGPASPAASPSHRGQRPPSDGRECHRSPSPSTPKPLFQSLRTTLAGEVILSTTPGSTIDRKQQQKQQRIVTTTVRNHQHPTETETTLSRLPPLVGHGVEVVASGFERNQHLSGVLSTDCCVAERVPSRMNETMSTAWSRSSSEDEGDSDELPPSPPPKPGSHHPLGARTIPSGTCPTEPEDGPLAFDLWPLDTMPRILMVVLGLFGFGMFLGYFSYTTSIE